MREGVVRDSTRDSTRDSSSAPYRRTKVVGALAAMLLILSVITTIGIVHVAQSANTPGTTSIARVPTNTQQVFPYVTATSTSTASTPTDTPGKGQATDIPGKGQATDTPGQGQPPIARATATNTIAVFPTATMQPPTPTNTLAPAPSPTYSETAGPYGSGTFTNYTNAGGTQGQRIAAYGTVQVSCRVTGWQRSGSPSGDYWWYRVKSSPWNDQYYAYADNFYNNGQTSGPLNNGVLVDTNVPLC